jgi:hypothetical protein
LCLFALLLPSIPALYFLFKVLPLGRSLHHGSVDSVERVERKEDSRGSVQGEALSAGGLNLKCIGVNIFFTEIMGGPWPGFVPTKLRQPHHLFNIRHAYPAELQILHACSLPSDLE